ncbi:hypothetical protein B0H10DRAFT_1974703 [Mycena sp. CBHHK59/15]|nr:hypothetical protein B0H10DRAFT_1974703 [Mycena sp. CBHHK59/15]
MSSSTPIPPTTFALECLGNFDVLCEVLQHIYDDGDGLHNHPVVIHQLNQRPRRNFPLNVALSCKALSELALHYLWHELHSLFPLLKLLPSFTEVKGVYALLGPLEAIEFIRFDHYAGRVRTIDWAISDSTTVDASVFLRIAQKHPEPILPRLEHLHLCSSVVVGSVIMLLLSPTLRYVHFQSDGAARQSIAFTTVLSAAADSVTTGLDHLALDGKFPPIIYIIPRFVNLKRLENWDIDQAIAFDSLGRFLRTICVSSHMTSLVLRDVPGSAEYNALDGLNLPLGAFQALNRLEVSAGFNFIYKLSGLGTSGLSHDFGYYSQDFVPSGISANFVSSAGRHLSYESKIFFGLVVGSGAQLGREHEPFPSIHSLIHFTTHCPSLVQLSISLAFDENLGNELPSVRAHGLQTLRVHDMMEAFSSAQTKALALFLDTTFPHLNHVEAADWLRNDWVEVNSLIKLFQTARGQKRQCMVLC